LDGNSSRRLDLDPRLWSALYGNRESLPKLPPRLEWLVQYHREAVVRSAAVGDDFGNVTGYNDGSAHGGTFGMNRLNHGAAIFENGWRANERRLTETALLWCDSFYHQSIWWGEPEPGGTRYNNLAVSQTPPTKDYMWRSDSSVNFCTKGYDCFWLAWEETGDPRMLEAFRAQTAYAARQIHANQGECRNIGDVRDFIRLHQYTGMILSGLEGWELSTGKVKDLKELYGLYRKPADRDSARLLAEPKPDKPLGLLPARSPEKSK
jgi:hypothetical protein